MLRSVLRAGSGGTANRAEQTAPTSSSSVCFAGCLQRAELLLSNYRTVKRNGYAESYEIAENAQFLQSSSWSDAWKQLIYDLSLWDIAYLEILFLFGNLLLTSENSWFSLLFGAIQNCD